MNDDHISEDFCINKKAVQKVKSKMLKDEIFYEISDDFKIFGNITRIKIIYALCKSELCVNDLAILLNSNSSAISHQLRILRNRTIVNSKRKGKVIYYSLMDENVMEMLKMIIKFKI